MVSNCHKWNFWATLIEADKMTLVILPFYPLRIRSYIFCLFWGGTNDPFKGLSLCLILFYRARGISLFSWRHICVIWQSSSELDCGLHLSWDDLELTTHIYDYIPLVGAVFKFFLAYSTEQKKKLIYFAISFNIYINAYICMSLKIFLIHFLHNSNDFSKICHTRRMSNKYSVQFTHTCSCVRHHSATWALYVHMYINLQLWVKLSAISVM